MQQSSGNLPEQIASSAYDVLVNFYRFSGRSSRITLVIGAMLANLIAGIVLTIMVYAKVPQPTWFAPFLSGCLTATLYVRRLHDSDHSGWWLLFPLMLIPASLYADHAGIKFPPTSGFRATVLIDVSNLGWVAMLVLAPIFALLLWPGTAGSNRFGRNPRIAEEPGLAGAAT